MNALLQSGIRCYDEPSAGRLAPSQPRHTVQVCLGFSGLRVPVSLRDCAISPRTVMNNASYAGIRIDCLLLITIA